MAEEETKKGAGQPAGREPIPEASELVRALGLIFSNTYLYGPKHSVTVKAMEDAFEILMGILEKHDEINFDIAEKSLMVNGVHLELKNPLMKNFVDTLAGLEVNNFTMAKGISADKFVQLVDIMSTKPDQLKQSGGFSGALATSGIDSVRSRTIVYRQITEDEVVVSKKTMEGRGGGGEGDGAGEAENVKTILALLKGDVSSDDENAAQGIQGAASDVEKLTELILEAAEERKESGVQGEGETLGDIVVGCLKRAYDGLMKDPAVKTQKGKKKLAKTLLLLQEKVLARMRDMAGGLDEKSAEAISTAVDEMSDELKMDALAAEYMKKRKAIDASEQRILRYIKAKGLDKIENTDLHDKLGDEGLDDDGWRELLAKSGASAGIGSLGAIGHLAELLVQIAGEGGAEGVGGGGEGAGKEGRVPVEELNKTLIEVDQEVKQFAAKTEEKIDVLIESAKEAEEAEKKGETDEPRKPKLSRKRLFEILAEMGQEICQPLAVISCSIDMIRAKSLGDVTEQQERMLALASTSGERLRKIADKLMDISGVPETMEPDAGIQSSIYQEA